MPEPLRILMVVNTPWTRHLGAPRVQVEIAEELRALGHHVDAYCSDDAFSRPPRVPRLALWTRNFPRHAARHIRQHPAAYDVIDARCGTLTATKRQLGFRGLLVARSTGLRPVYEREFLATERRAHPGRRATRALSAADRVRQDRRVQLSLERCDVLNVLNSDEERFAREELGYGDKTVKFLHGLTADRMVAMDRARRPAAERHAAPLVAFVGSWTRRKGADDMARIVAGVRAAVPGARFRFLGTAAPEERVIAALGGIREGIEAFPSFESDDLPELLGAATVGILPSYVEGFPFGVLELLASGLPVVAYDAPGARETLPALDRSLLVPRGDAEAFAHRVAELLRLAPDAYAELSEAALTLARSYRWNVIAADTADAYRERLEALR